MNRVFLGWDSNEPVAYAAAASSLGRLASSPVSITGLFIDQLPLTRKREGSTEFSFSRFLVPWLCGYEGNALFVDGDILCRTDINELFALFDAHHAVQVVKHDYTPKDTEKFLGHKQTAYPRKNWSSVMLFNNERCRALTPEYVNTASGADLHQFAWTEDVGALPAEWNHLIGEYAPNPNAKIAHFTLGTPCFAKYSRCEYSQEWYEEKVLAFSHNRLGEFSLPEREAA